MKDCCKTRDKEPGSDIKKWITTALWMVAMLLIIGMALVQILSS